MATIFIAMFIYLFEVVKAPHTLGKFFDAFGKNPLFIFVLSGALPRLLGLFRFQTGTKLNELTKKLEPVYSTPLTWLQQHVFLPISTDKQVGSFLFAVFMIIFYWLVAYIMDRKRIYVKV
jgi:predicted acyltransferase